MIGAKALPAPTWIAPGLPQGRLRHVHNSMTNDAPFKLARPENLLCPTEGVLELFFSLWHGL